MVTSATCDPIAVADVVLDAALAVDADAVRIEPQTDHYTITVARAGELLAVSRIDSTLAQGAIARLGYVCQIDVSAVARAATGRSRVRSCDTQRDLLVTISPGPRAELLFVACEGKPAARNLDIGERIGHYRIVGPLGAGGMGDVYEVEHETLGKRAALKVLQRAVIARDTDSLERFVREAQATARIRSPHIVEVFDFGYLDDHRPYFVMELLRAHSLLDLLDLGAMPVTRAVMLARQVAQGLVAAHSQGVIHADVTPSNVLVEDERVKIIDFGLAQLREHARPNEVSELVTGTPDYMAPEQLRGFAATEASDQYALGCVMYEMLAGAPPFDGRTAKEICEAHVRTPAPRARSPYGPVPAMLSATIARCLIKDPARRYPSMQAVVNALEVAS